MKNLQGQCQHCGGIFEFQAESAGSTAVCPHCGQPTELMPALPTEAVSPLRTKAVVFTLVALVILAGGLVGSIWALKQAELITKPQQAANANARAQPPLKPLGPFSEADFEISPVTVEKGQGSGLVHAIGSITNTANRQRFGVRVEIELQDDAGNRAGTATDYQPTLEPNSIWRFRALVVDKKATTAKVVAIKEEK
jgi:hypothetical protein